MVQQAPAPAAQTISQDDRLLAGCCHISLFVGFPVIAPLVIYALKKDTSRFVAFHALQAAIAHLSVIPLMIAGYILAIAFTLGMGTVMGEQSLFLPFGFMGAWVVGFCFPWLLIAAISLYAGVRAFSGQGYRIPLVARIVLRIMAPVAPSPSIPI
jgi:uncharacterized Tic20 family protein